MDNETLNQNKYIPMYQVFIIYYTTTIYVLYVRYIAEESYMFMLMLSQVRKNSMNTNLIFMINYEECEETRNTLCTQKTIKYSFLVGGLSKKKAQTTHKSS